MSFWYGKLVENGITLTDKNIANIDLTNTNLAWNDLESNPSLYGDTPVTDVLKTRSNLIYIKTALGTAQ